ncbi:MAG: UDP-N-acetylmuramoyl-L-alanyl-D-glutamate--2,6-diaminopimelate ligase, partial [Fimbriimonadaceae bacterium]
MNLLEIFAKAGVSPARLHDDTRIDGIRSDSRRVRPGDLFVCMPGTRVDSHQFIPQAKAAGAVAVLAHTADGFEAALGEDLPAALVLPDGSWQFQEAVWRLCDAFFEHPTRQMKVVGVTGTNGKTTTAWLVRDMLRALGLRSAYLGTLGFHLPDEERELANTTPFAVELYNLLAEARDRGVEALAMEVSSHALAERRVDGVEFDVAVFTNLTQDHLDYHGTMEAYEAAKRRLFEDLPRQTAKPTVAAVNVGDPVGRRWAEWIDPARRLRFAVVAEPGSFGLVPAELELAAEATRVSLDRIHLVLRGVGHDDVGFVAPLGGRYNVENLAAAAGAVKGLGFPMDDIGEWGGRVRPVPGRFEPVPNEAGIGILVDYAHTPDALEKLLDAVRPLTAGRVITVFGCGGDRDRTKRPKMARAASERSDLVVVTSDNPRTEDPEQILDDIVAGL